MENFTRDRIYKTAVNSDRLESDPFEMIVGSIKTKWTIGLDLGHSNNYALAIYLVKKEESSQNYKFKVRFSIMNSKREVWFSEFSDKSDVLPIGCGRGYDNFLTHDKLFTRFKTFVSDSQLMIEVNVSLSQYIESKQPQ